MVLFWGRIDFPPLEIPAGRARSRPAKPGVLKKVAHRTGNVICRIPHLSVVVVVVRPLNLGLSLSLVNNHQYYRDLLLASSPSSPLKATTRHTTTTLYHGCS